MKKYKLTKESIEWCGKTLFRIEAVTSFGSIKKGDKGGFIEKEENLSQVSGDAWVSGDARVYDNARVFGNAHVSGDASVYGYAQVSEDARVYGYAQVSSNAWMYGNAQVYGAARVSGNARVYGDAQVYGYARVYGNAWVYGDAWVSGDVHVYGYARVYGKLKITAGFFFDVRYQKEEIKYKQVDENYELIYKGEAKFEEEEPSLVGTEVTVTVGEKTYKARIVA